VVLIILNFWPLNPGVLVNISRCAPFAINVLTQARLAVTNDRLFVPGNALVCNSLQTDCLQ